MVSFTNAAPKPVFLGIKDESIRALPVIREAVPQHLPLLYLQTQRGPLAPQLVAGKDALDMYGRRSFMERSKWFSHQTMAFTTCNGNGNLCFIKRVVAANATRSSLVFYLEIVPADLPAYERESDGEVIRDVNGDKIIHATDTVDGYLMRWSVKALDDIDNLRGELKTQGTLVGRTGETSTRYPVMAMRMGVGGYGNNIGLRLSQPGPATSYPTNPFVIEDQRAMVYRAQWVEREDEFSLPFITASQNAEQFVDFAFKDDVVNTKTELDLPLERMLEEYRSIDPSTGAIPKYGPIDDLYYYQENLEEILELIYAKEVAAGSTSVQDMHMMNVFDALDYNGVDHYAIRLSSDSLDMDDDTTHYGIGGSDGDVNEATLDQLVYNEILYNWNNIEHPLDDHARYPFSILYDTGFTLETKKVVIGAVGWRPDISVSVSTQVVGEPDNAISEETSIATALRSYARLFPESTLFATPVCRVVVVGQCGRKLKSFYKNRLPILHELIHKRSKYMGAGDGKYKPAFAYDVAPANRIEEMVEVNHPWKPDNVRTKDWSLGLNWVQHADRRQLFFPAVQTVYDNDTSVLNNDINMLICVDILKQCEEVWRQMSGNTKLTSLQFAERSNEILANLVRDRYDGRVTIVPNAHYTPADEARGYSWTMEVIVYMNNMKTVEQIKLITRRSDDLAAAA